MDTVSGRWHTLVEEARQPRARGTLARWRDELVCRLAENIAEQRTLWALRSTSSAQLVHSSSFTPERARAEMENIVAGARRHHGRWLIGDGLLFIASGFLALVPDPTARHYFLFRLIGHLVIMARRTAGESHQLDVRGKLAAGLETLVEVPRAERASRVRRLRNGSTFRVCPRSSRTRRPHHELSWVASPSLRFSLSLAPSGSAAASRATARSISSAWPASSTRSPATSPHRQPKYQTAFATTRASHHRG
jgi:hypothetical protein